MGLFREILVTWAKYILNKYEPDIFKERGFNTIEDVLDFYIKYKSARETLKKQQHEELHSMQLTLEQTRKLVESDYDSVPKDIIYSLIKDYSKLLKSIDTIRDTSTYNSKSYSDEMREKLYDDTLLEKIPADGGIDSIVKTLEDLHRTDLAEKIKANLNTEKA